GPDILESDIGRAKRRLGLGGGIADRYLGCGLWPPGVGLRPPGVTDGVVRKRRRSVGARGKDRFDRENVVRIGFFQRLVGLHWRSLALSNVTRTWRCIPRCEKIPLPV